MMSIKTSLRPSAPHHMAQYIIALTTIYLIVITEAHMQNTPNAVFHTYGVCGSCKVTCQVIACACKHISSHGV